MRKIRTPNREDVIPVDPAPQPLKKAAAPDSRPAVPVVRAAPAPSAKPAEALRTAAVVKVSRNAPSVIAAGKPDPVAPEVQAERKPVLSGKLQPAEATYVPIAAGVSSPRDAGEPGPRSLEGMRIVRRHTLAAGGAGCIPLPGADVLTVTGIQANLIEEIARVYGFTPTPGWSWRLAGLLFFSAGGFAAGQLVFGSLAKSIPVFGTLLGIGSVAAYSAATTYALGRSIIHHFEKGGNPDHVVTASLVRDIRDGFGAGLVFWRTRRPTP